ncbi:hypothetical protein LEN26_001387 [Aphanomyces euteiches]|nr:hypothetical protein AeMF1_016605 [Aphanomyces euteiches]KAH9131412.1 hypothetical protein AeNC1_019652 [Aphanomyces euteiches]KAH9161472.1 hypothetical protein LEN26_001387 [Aphanomyces euteiches]
MSDSASTASNLSSRIKPFEVNCVYFPSQHEVYRVKGTPSTNGVRLWIQSMQSGLEWECKVGDLSAHAVDGANGTCPLSVWLQLSMALENKSPWTLVDLIHDKKGQPTMLLSFQTLGGAVNSYKFCMVPVARGINANLVSMMKNLVQSVGNAGECHEMRLVPLEVPKSSYITAKWTVVAGTEHPFIHCNSYGTAICFLKPGWYHVSIEARGDFQLELSLNDQKIAKSKTFQGKLTLAMSLDLENTTTSRISVVIRKCQWSDSIMMTILDSQ